MKQLLTALGSVPEFNALTAALDSGRSPAAVSGLSLTQRAYFAAGLWNVTGRPVVFLCADEADCRRVSSDLRSLTGETVAELPAREFTFHDAAVVSREWEHRRLSTLFALMGERPPAFTVATAEAVLQRTMPPGLMEKSCLVLKMGRQQDLSQVAEALSAAGYTRCQQVEGVGQFALRGGILDVFSPAYPQPVRVEFWGDEVDSMGFFEVDTQRRTGALEEAVILPAAEVLSQLAPGGTAALVAELRKRSDKWNGEKVAETLRRDSETLENGLPFPAADRYLALIYPRMATALDYFPPDAAVVVSESPRFSERCRNYLWQLNEDVKVLAESGHMLPELGRLCLTDEELGGKLENWAAAFLDSFTSSRYPARPRELLTVTAKQLPSYGVSLETAVSDLNHYTAAGYSVVVLAGSEQRCLNLQSLLREQKVTAAVDFGLKALPAPGKAVICRGGLSSGMEFPGAKLAVLTEGQATPVKRKNPVKATNREKLKSYADLSVGDLVVHQAHGIGRYQGMVKMPVDGVEKDYVKIAYAGSDVLYVPATQLDMVSKYIGGGEDANETRKLSKLGGTEWEKQKSRAKKAVQDLAQGLIRLYAQRQRQPGFAFSPDTPWQKEFEDEFEYTETDDQLRCIGEIKRDMEQPRPMDRLLCGDVGYGKTEVAFRAIMKCVMDGKQAAILVPTTVLARQHYLSAKQRFAKFPVNVDVISRFRTPAQMKETLYKVSTGGVDLLIGTHRLLQKDVCFKDLGLLVVDEEQRFGVTHKEKLKELARQVDVLTLSATPIPRTLNMALSGIRDMSTLEEPPMDRQPVQTYVMEHDWSVLSDAIRRELERGGQVYYLHNRVETIARTAGRIRELLGGEAEVAVAHGKMSQEELNDVMTRMSEGEVDVLVCTTIIETGIDIANVNTLIIEDADKMGLAQLHQIRGRVGRSSRRAFAYLTYRRGKVLTEVASKRLGAIREFAEFGSGFKIAMRDLEIRGAGNVLGPEQSGFLMSVGYDMYLKLLEEAVLTQQGESAKIPEECTADLTVAASIPDRYVPSAEQRMDLYRKIAMIRSESDADDVTDELIDRYGDPPRQVNNLIAVAVLRSLCAQNGIAELTQKGSNLVFALKRFELRQVSALCGSDRWKGRVLFSAGEKPALTLRLKKGEDPLKLGRAMAEDYAAGAGGEG